MQNLMTQMAQLEADIQSKLSLAKQQLALLQSTGKHKLISPKTFGLAFLAGFLLTYSGHSRNKAAAQTPLVKRLMNLIPKAPLLLWLTKR